MLYKEIAPGKTSAAQSQVSAGGQRFDFVQLLVRQVGGNHRLGYTVFILVVIGIKLCAGQNLAGAGGAHFLRVIRVANGGTFHFLPINKLFKHHFVIFPQGGVNGGVQLFTVVGLGDAHAGTRIGRFDKDRVGQAVFHAGQQGAALGFRFGSDGAAPVAVGHMIGVHDGIGNGFVHAGSGCQNAAAHIGDGSQLQQALNRAVLAVFAVQDGGDHIHRQQFIAVGAVHQQAMVAAVRAEHAGHAGSILLPAAAAHALGRAAVFQPAALFGNAHQNHFISVRHGGKGIRPCRSRNTADLMLA